MRRNLGENCETPVAEMGERIPSRGATNCGIGE